MKSFLQILLFLLVSNFVVAEELNVNASSASPLSLTVSVSNIRYNSFRVSWSANPDATSYKLYAQYLYGWPEDDVYKSFTGYDGKALGMTVLSYDVTNVDDNWSLKRKVIIQAIRNGAVIEEKELKFEVLGNPQTFSLSVVDNKTIRLTWDVYKWNTYTIYVYKKVGETLQSVTGYPVELYKTLAYDNFQYDVSGLDGGTPYVFALKRYENGYGITCDTIHYIKYTPAVPPQAKAASLIKPNSFQANWSISPMAPQFKLYVKDGDGKWVLHGQVIENMLGYKLDNLEPGSTYSYQVSSINPNGESDLSNVISVTTTALPVPVAINADMLYSWAFNAKWEALSGATGYQLQVSDGNVWTHYEISSGSTNHYFVEGLKPNFNYEYRIKAYFSNGYTKYSNVIQVKTLNAPVAINVLRSQANPTQATLVWSAFTGATGYKLWVKSNEGAANNPAGYFPKIVTSVESQVITGLIPGHSYQFYVQAITATGTSAESNRIDFFTYPATPVALPASEITSTSFNAEWDDIYDDADRTYLTVYNSATSIVVPGYSAREVTLESETVTGLTFNSVYFYYVEVEKNGLRSNISNQIIVKTDYRELTLSCSPAAAGTCTGGGWVKNNSSVTVNATSKAGYEFVNWTESGTEVSKSASYTFTITKNRSLLANFVAISQYVVSISSNPQTGGTVTGDGAYSTGSSVTVSASPNPGYTFTNWTEGGNQVSTSANYTFSVTANRSLTANFTKNSSDVYTLSLSATQGGTVSGTGAYASNSTVTAIATANNGYEFVNWTEGGSEVSKSASYTFTINSNRSLTANFTLSTPTNHMLSLSANPINGGSVSGGGTYATGTSVTIVATPAKGYVFESWTENGSKVSNKESYTFTLASGRTLVANFRLATANYTLTLSANPTAGGTVTGAATYSSGASVTAIAAPNTGYNFVNWTEGSSVVSTSASYTFTISANRTLTANFEQSALPDYTLSLSASPVAGGTVSGGGSYSSGTLVTAIATSNTGFEFVNWTEGITVVSTSANYTLTINSTKNLTANFRQKAINYNLSLTTNPIAGGTATGGGTYSSGTTVTAAAVANEGYIFENWTYGSAVVSASANYTFPLNSNQTLIANFKLKTGVGNVANKVIKIYPNPASCFVVIAGAKEGSMFSIQSISGKEMISGKIISSGQVVDVGELASGIYLLTVQTGNSLVASKLIKK